MLCCGGMGASLCNCQRECDSDNGAEKSTSTESLTKSARGKWQGGRDGTESGYTRDKQTGGGGGRYQMGGVVGALMVR